MELEQEAAESRDEFSLQQDQAHGHNQHQLAADGAGGGGGFSRRMSVGGGGSGGDRAEERALRAKNEMLERQLAHMRDAAEEAQLELAAARKVPMLSWVVVGCLVWWWSAAVDGFGTTYRTCFVHVPTAANASPVAGVVFVLVFWLS